MSQPVRVLERADVRRLFKHVARPQNRFALRNTVMCLLSYKCGLRAAEQANLQWQAVLTAGGRIDDFVSVSNRIAKYGSGRRIPLHPDLKAALTRLHHAQKRPRSGPIIQSARGSFMRPQSIVNWYKETYRQLGLNTSSHAGRRYYITQAARLLPRVGGSMKDVQELAGHRSLSTTEGYIAGSRSAQLAISKLI